MNSRTCQECGSPFENAVAKTRFCSTGCREVFNRRRRDRGAELYDVYMSVRYDDHGAESHILDNMVKAYKVADHVKRDGRPSWQPWSEAQMAIPQAYGKAGDNR